MERTPASPPPDRQITITTTTTSPGLQELINATGSRLDFLRRHLATAQSNRETQYLEHRINTLYQLRQQLINHRNHETPPHR